jgi:ABC-type uncharacterized transport system permease subunit
MSDSLTIIPVDTLTAAQAHDLVKQSSQELPTMFTLSVSYFILFQSRAQETKLAQAIMELMQRDYRVTITKENRFMRLKLVCEKDGI